MDFLNYFNSHLLCSVIRGVKFIAPEASLTNGKALKTTLSVILIIENN
jgi:hypothetical protein